MLLVPFRGFFNLLSCVFDFLKCGVDPKMKSALKHVIVVIFPVRQTKETPIRRACILFSCGFTKQYIYAYKSHTPTKPGNMAIAL